MKCSLRLRVVSSFHLPAVGHTSLDARVLRNDPPRGLGGEREEWVGGTVLQRGEDRSGKAAGPGARACAGQKPRPARHPQEGGDAGDLGPVYGELWGQRPLLTHPATSAGPLTEHGLPSEKTCHELKAYWVPVSTLSGLHV